MNIFEPKIKPNMYYLIIIMEDVIKWKFSNHNTSLLTFPKSINFTKVINKGHTTFQAATLCASYQFYHSLKLNLWNSDLKKHQLWEISFSHLCYHHYYGITMNKVMDIKCMTTVVLYSFKDTTWLLEFTLSSIMGLRTCDKIGEK